MTKLWRYYGYAFNNTGKQEVWSSSPRLVGLRVSPLRVSGGVSTLQSRASSLQSTAQDFPSGPQKDSSESNNNPIKKEAHQQKHNLAFPQHKYFTIVHYNTLWYYAIIWYNMIWYHMIWYNIRCYIYIYMYVCVYIYIYIYTYV